MHDFDPNKIQLLAEANVEAMVLRAFKRAGMDTLRSMYTSIRELYDHLEADLITNHLVCIAPLDITAEHFGSPYNDFQLLAKDIEAVLRSESVTILLSSSGNASWKTGTIDMAGASEQSIVYHYYNEEECIFAKGKYKALINPMRNIASVFALPSFKELEKALDRFKRTVVRHSAGFAFESVWAEPDRIHFRTKPEAQMRDSLYEFLKATFRDATTRKEAVVDSSHPVDLMLTWISTPRVALIEVKWVGDSMTAAGKMTSYRDARGRSGARQLEDYLDKNAQQVPLHTSKGYLVVIDGRRKGVDAKTAKITYADGMHYVDNELVYDIPTSTRRIDFSAPIRMFAEPICKLA